MENRTYKYLGITFSDSVNYPDRQETLWMERSRKVLNQMRARALWSFNRFEISKTLWKALAVPWLTYANAVTVMSKTLGNKISTAQIEAGRYALGTFNIKWQTNSSVASWAGLRTGREKLRARSDTSTEFDPCMTTDDQRLSGT